MTRLFLEVQICFLFVRCTGCGVTFRLVIKKNCVLLSSFSSGQDAEVFEKVWRGLARIKGADFETFNSVLLLCHG